MTPTVFILILNPATSAIFAAALFVLWHHQRHLTYIGLLGLAFALKTFAYLVQFVTLTAYADAARFVSTSLFMATATLLVGGLIARYDPRPPYRLLTAISVATMAIVTFHLVVEPNYTARVVAINVGMSAIFVIAVRMLDRRAGRSFAERMQVWLMGLNLLAALCRPIPLLLDGSPRSSSIDSVYWLGVTGSDIVASLLLVLSILTGVALDVFGRLRTESIQDSLSGLLNRRGFEERATERLAAGRAAGGRSALVLVDLDRFKAINDTYGHGAGDEVIALFARVLADAAGTEAVCGRIGGEEFAVLLPGADAAQAGRFAETVRISLALTPTPTVQVARPVTASFGIAALAPGETLGEALQRADKALYRAKEDGRDCIRTASTGPQGTVGGRRVVA